MLLSKLSAGKDLPNDFNVVVEIPAFGAPVKYEIDKDSGALLVDRLISTAMYYPCNYGFIPHTLSPDGDPVDVLVLTPTPLQAGSVVRCRPLGMLAMSDEKGEDTKILAVPVSKLTPLYDSYQNYQDVPAPLLTQISHFFEQYKALEKGKWVKVEGWRDLDAARADIQAAVERAGNN